MATVRVTVRSSWVTERVSSPAGPDSYTKVGFDFSVNYRVLAELGQTLLERSKLERGDARKGAREALQNEALATFERVLELDPENLSAHYNLALLHELMGNADEAAHHRQLHTTYKPDENARDKAFIAARKKSPAANHTAESVVIYDLQRPGGMDWASE